MVGNTNVLRMAECSPVCSLGDGIPTELYLVNYKIKTKDRSPMLYGW